MLTRALYSEVELVNGFRGEVVDTVWNQGQRHDTIGRVHRATLVHGPHIRGLHVHHSGGDNLK